MPDKISCFIVGEDSLLIKCAETLVDKNHNIYGIISSNKTVINWANKKQLAVHELSDQLISVLKSKPFDYLFSITNLSILSDEIISSPKKSAINFHDGPLPKFAGINATSWAIIKGEKTHGITWHEMTTEVDKGKILKQVMFDIAQDENSLSLNAKCFESGSASFEELIDELASDTNKPVKQNFSERSYFGKYKRPDDAAIIDWSKNAEEILRLVRALDFGRYTNPLGLPKMKIKDNYFLPIQMKISDQKSEMEPGTVTAINTNTFSVSTASTDVVIEKVLKINGKPVSISELIEKHSLKVGNIFDSESTAAKIKLNEFLISAAKNENYWVDRLKSVDRLELHYAKKNSTINNISNFEISKVKIPAELTKLFNDKDLSNSEIAAAAFSIFIGRHSGKESFDIGVCSGELHQQLHGMENLFELFPPVKLAIDNNNLFNSSAKKIVKSFSAVKQKLTYTKDVFARYPELHFYVQNGAASTLSVNIVIADEKPVVSFPDTSVINFISTNNFSDCKIVYDSFTISKEDINLFSAQFQAFVEGLILDKNLEVGKISILSSEERKKLIEEWNNTKTDFPVEKCVHQLFEVQVGKSPDKIAVSCRRKNLTYSQLNEKANQLAQKLVKSGIKPDSLIGVCLSRSTNMMVAIMATLKAGGAYVPLDPDFPSDRISYMIEDSKCSVIISEKKLKNLVSSSKSKVVFIDEEWDEISKESKENFNSQVNSSNLSYVIYTSGSTGKPKGVMVQHCNVVNFFAGMDKHIQYDPPGVWLAVTSLSFDISVLELFWTLCRGFKIVVYAEQDWKLEQIKSSSKKKNKKIDFSLFYFSSYAGENPTNKYRLLLEGAKFADQNRFTAVWTPERHFHDFGGLYPNPSVAGAGIATITNHVRIMSGSCVSPLHSPIRIAEEWSVVDNLSNGRVGISFAAGWQPNDFVIMPENYENRKDIMFEQIETVRKLWRGESVEFTAPNGKQIEVKTLPRPIQKDLPVWITAAGNPETFQMAGERGFRILTHLLGQKVEDVADKIAIYKKAWKDAGHPGEGYATLMLHTFIGENLDEVREIVRQPMKDYLKSAANLVKLASWYFPTFKKEDKSLDEAANSLTDEDMDAILDHSFERYFETSSLLGTPETAIQMTDKLKKLGVDEIACLIDFGIDSEVVLSHLQYLNSVKTLSNLGVRETIKVEDDEFYSVAELMNDHNVTHMQCTPSMAKMLLMAEDSKDSLNDLQFLMIGGEAFPVSLAQQLREKVKGNVLNMYGPTETTIWSSVYNIDGISDTIPIGTPIANTDMYILDQNHQPLPIGVPGELCIGGEGVVRGYFQREELTNERFIPHPLKNNKRIYKTGDLAYFRKDGIIEFLGRLDHQVKIRGYRIELGEIETILEKHTLVRECVVIAREDIPGEKKLVGYLTTKTGSHPSVNDLRDFLKAKLPEYMVPSAFVFMDAMPLTPNGKIDRKALPSPDAARPELGKDFVDPKTATEKTLAKLWCEVLGIEKIGLSDNFFDLGGHSLSAVQVTVKIHQAYSVNMPLQTFFQASTLEELASKVEEKLLDQAEGKDLEKLLSEIENVSDDEAKTIAKN